MANVFIEENTLTAIGDAIRAKTGGTEGILPADMPAQIESIETGTVDGNDAFWSTYQDNGNRADYNNAFAGIGWSNNTFKPKYDIVPTSAYMMFRNSQISGDFVEILNDLGVAFDTSNLTNPQYMFNNTDFTHFGVMDFSQATNHAQCFYYSSQLHTIDKVIFNPSVAAYNTTFDGCSALVNIVVEPNTIGGSGLSFKSCKNLSKASHISIVGGLLDSAAKSITFSATAVNAAFETSEGANDGSTSAEWTALVATKPSWTITIA